jgi:serine phosphatase RsbU (regulator of sigma subunit)
MTSFFLPKVWRSLLGSGLGPDMSYFLQRRIMLANAACLICIAFNLFFAVHLAWVGLYVIVAQNLGNIGLLGYFFYLTKTGNFRYSAILLSVYPTVATLVAGVSHLLTPLGPILISQYVNIQIVLLATLLLPVLFIDIRKKALFWGLELGILATILFYDLICGWFGVAHYQLGIVAPDYGGTRIHLLAVAVSLMFCAYFLVSTNLKYENLVLDLLKANEEKNSELGFANFQIKAKNEELQASQEELRQNMEELEANQEFIREQKHSLEIAYKAVENSNLRINDSIRYAQRIQQAILPKEETLRAAFAEYFVILRPKDVVSGDFYWYHEAQGEHFLAVVDCTGHGVPGAFMSMIGRTLLQEITGSRGVSEPAQVLHELHLGIQQSLGLHDADLRDGMDVALCALKTVGAQVRVRFSGARRSLYYFAGPGLHEVRGDRMTIGQTQFYQPFGQHELWLAPGDTLYLTTDGWADAINPEREKFGLRYFREMLVEGAHLPLTGQCEMFEAMLDDFAQGMPQRDDLLLVGIRV